MTELLLRDLNADGDLGGSFNIGQNTTDRLVVDFTVDYNFTPNFYNGGVRDLNTSKATSFAENGVIICQAKE